MEAKKKAKRHENLRMIISEWLLCVLLVVFIFSFIILFENISRQPNTETLNDHYLVSKGVCDIVLPRIEKLSEEITLSKEITLSEDTASYENKSSNGKIEENIVIILNESNAIMPENISSIEINTTLVDKNIYKTKGKIYLNTRIEYDYDLDGDCILVRENTGAIQTFDYKFFIDNNQGTWTWDIGEKNTLAMFEGFLSGALLFLIVCSMIKIKSVCRKRQEINTSQIGQRNIKTFIKKLLFVFSLIIGILFMFLVIYILVANHLYRFYFL